MVDSDTLVAIQDIPEKQSKFPNKLDIKSKLLVIRALDDGQIKSEVAKDYSISQRTVGIIYKQKEILLRKYSQLLSHQVNVDQVLLEWFLLETKCGKLIHKNIFHQKATEIIKTLSVDAIDIDEWLQEFKMKNNISEFVADVTCNLNTKEEWIKFLSDFKSSEVYFGGMFALSHRFDTESYLKGQSSEEYVSIMFITNTTGTDKQQLAVIGKDIFVKNATMKSLPVKYYTCHNDTPQINFSLINDYLENWDNILDQVGKQILLILNLPDILLHKFKLKNIKLFTLKDYDFITHVSDKVIECFKFNYRILDITRDIKSRDSCPKHLSEYVHMFAMAWHTVSSRYIELLCSPQIGDFLYFDVNGENYGNHSLSHWYKMKNIPLSLDDNSKLLLDKYIYCDSKLKCIDLKVVDVCSNNANAKNKKTKSKERVCSSFEAYQAMRRLISHLQEQNAGPLAIKNAKILENLIEHKALTQMHVINQIK